MKENLDYLALVNELRRNEAETTWFEFKTGNSKPEMIGECISALSNSAALESRMFAYMIWGVDDTTHDIVGTSFHPLSEKRGNQELTDWLISLLVPRLSITFNEVFDGDKKLVILTIPSASTQPTRFQGDEFIRIGSYNKKLKDHPQKERALWRSFDKEPIEKKAVSDNLSEESLSSMLSFQAYFQLFNLPLPQSRNTMIQKFLEEGFCVKNDDGSYAITALGALLFATNLSQFPSISHRAVRIIKYKTKNRLETINDETFTSGYANCFNQICTFTCSLLPQLEKLNSPLMEKKIALPATAIREALGNMLAHQDLSESGRGPLVEVFSDRLEISNPGDLLVPIDRIIDTSPKARNEALISFLRRIHICEERGSGFDRIEEDLSQMHVPFPSIESQDGFTRLRFLWPSSSSEWTKPDILRTCYYCTCYCFIYSIPVSNQILRERLGIPEKRKAMVSRIINEAIEKKRLSIEDPDVGIKGRRYIPYWA